MNKMFLKILVILGLIAPVSVDAMKRVDSPGVAQRKLNLLLKDVRSMTDKEKEQALRDLSPSLREDYQDMLAQSNIRKENIKVAVIDMMELINIKYIKNSSDIDDVIDVIAKANNLNNKEIKEVKFLANKYLIERQEVKQEKQEEKEDKKETEDKKDQKQDFSAFLGELRAYFDKQLANPEKSYEVTSKLAGNQNRFVTNVNDYEADAQKINNFFIELQIYQGQAAVNWSITCIQRAFSNEFFELIHSLYAKVARSENSEDISNLFIIMDKCNKVLNTYTKTGVLGDVILIVDKPEINENKEKIVIAKTNGYLVFAEEYKAIKGKYGMLNPSNDLKNVLNDTDTLELNND